MQIYEELKARGLIAQVTDEEEIREIQRGIDIDMPEELFEQWRKEYRRIDKS